MTAGSEILAPPEIRILEGRRQGAVPTFDGKYLSLTTFRRDGRGVATPVWFVEENGRLLLETDAGSGKVKRIRRSPVVAIAPCTARGRVRRDPTPARAELLPDRMRTHVEGLLKRKYRVDLIFIRPIRALQSRFGRERSDRPTIVAITPDGVH